MNTSPTTRRATTFRDPTDPQQVSNGEIIRRLLRFMAPFNRIMFTSLTARIIKFCGQAAVLGIAAASVGIYINSAEPGVVNWDVLWTQVGWIALFGTIVGLASYIENYHRPLRRLPDSGGLQG